jgi:superfamily II helicase
MNAEKINNDILEAHSRMMKRKPDEIKTCHKCHKSKPMTEYYPSDDYKGGYKHICRTCLYEASRQKKVGPGRLQHIFENPEKLKEWNEKHDFKLNTVAKMYRAFLDHYGERMNHASM